MLVPSSETEGDSWLIGSFLFVRRVTGPSVFEALSS